MANDNITSPAPAGLFLHALVQTFKTDAALVATIGKAARMSQKQRASLAAGLSAMRRDGRKVAHLQGLALAVAGAGTVVTVFDDGRAGIGPILSDEPADLQTIKARAAEDGTDLPAGFLVIVFPAGAVAESLQ